MKSGGCKKKKEKKKDEPSGVNIDLDNHFETIG
jgi:hypothetical protein